MCTASFDGEQVHLLRQVDDFALACASKALADKTCDITGAELQLPKEDKPPFSKMGLTNDFNGTDIQQTDSHIKLSCRTCTDQLVTSHGWKEEKQIKDVSETIAPLNTKALKQVHAQKGPSEGTAEHEALEDKHGFRCRTLLGEMMHACVTCACSRNVARCL